MNTIHLFHPLPEDPDTSAASETIPFRVTCAWCGEVIEDGPGPVSHGMCQKCRTAFLAMLPEE